MDNADNRAIVPSSALYAIAVCSASDKALQHLLLGTAHDATLSYQYLSPLFPLKPSTICDAANYVARYVAGYVARSKLSGRDCPSGSPQTNYRMLHTLTATWNPFAEFTDI